MALLTNGEQDAMVSDINVTPLVDVMLVLLTVFIVTAPLLMNSVSVKLPKAAASVAMTQPKTAHISVTQNGDIYLNDTQLKLEELEPKLRQDNAGGELSLEIFADEKAFYGVVAKVMAAIQRAGVSKFSFVMMPDTASHS